MVKNNKLVLGLVIVLIIFPLFFIPSVLKGTKDQPQQQNSPVVQEHPTTPGVTPTEQSEVQEENGLQEVTGENGNVEPQGNGTGTSANGVASSANGTGTGTTTSSSKGGTTVASQQNDNLEFELVQTEGTKFVFEHITKNTGDKPIKLVFPTEKELDWNLAILELYEEFEQKGNGNAPKEVKKGRTITIQPNETLVHNITIPSELIPKAKYELTVQLAAENVTAPKLAIEFENK